MDRTLERRGLMFVLSSPSGAGKTSIAKTLLEKDSNLSLSVSMTTRKPRENEIDGKDYHFISDEEFLEKIKQDVFLEYATVFDNFYGTEKNAVEEMLKNGKDVLFDIDWQGTQQMQDKCPQDLVRVFIIPPSLEILRERLAKRATDTGEIVDRRMRDALAEISHFAEYDYVIINNTLEKSVNDVYTILKAERLKRFRQIGMVDFVNQMRTH